jgi:hypothetical protein
MSGAVEGVALLPCPNPWCEEVEGVEASRHITTEKWHVCCDDCMIEGPWADSYDLAIAAWNTRTTPPARSYADGVEDAAKVAEEQTRLNVQARRDRADDALAFEFQGLGDVITTAIRRLSQGGKA